MDFCVELLSLHYVTFAFLFFLSFVFVVSVRFCGASATVCGLWRFCHPTLTLSVDKFRYSALCYHLLIIDLIKTATVCGQIVPNHLLCLF